MEKLWNYIKVNTKHAAKTVFRKFKEYLPFLAALFVIQCVLFSIFITKATNSKNTANTLYEKFDHDLVVSGLTPAQSIEADNILYIQSLMKKRCFESYKIEQASLEEGGDFRIYVVMRDGEEVEQFVDYYIKDMLGDPSNIEVRTTPLYEYKSSINTDMPNIFLILAICLISVIAVTAIYSIRINSQKFMYGIYITFGANLGRLISSAVFEMMVLAVLLFIPSALFTYLFAYFAYLPFSITPVISLKIILRVFLCVLLISIAGVYLPMKLVSRKTPLSLISSNDNSNYVSSPQRSTNLLGKTFPKHYEFLSMWRFRKYYVKLILSSVIFTSIFICGFYVSDMYTLAKNQPIQEFVVLNQSTATPKNQMDDINFLHDTISKMDNVSAVTWSSSTSASELSSFVITERSVLRSSSGIYTSINNLSPEDPIMQEKYDEYKDSGYNTVTNSFKYSAFNERNLAYIEKNYKVEGDIYSVLNDEKTVIVSDEIFNTKNVNFKVGDKIIVSKHMENISSYDGDYFDSVGLLEHLVEDNTYEFYEFTVGAVIKDYGDTEGRFTIGMNETDYRTVTNNRAVPKTVDVMLDPNTSITEANELDKELSSLFYYMGSEYRLTRTHSVVEHNITLEENQSVFVVFLSYLVLVMCPVVWFFSQFAFFGKRKNELYVLKAYGAREKNISKIFIYSGAVVSLLGFLISIIMSLPMSFVIYKAMSSWLPSLGFGSAGINYKFYLSPIALLLSAFIAAISGFLSAYLPYKLSITKNNKTKRNDI